MNIVIRDFLLALLLMITGWLYLFNTTASVELFLSIFLLVLVSLNIFINRRRSNHE